MAERVASNGWKYFFLGIMIIYMYGAICLKYVSGAESFVAGVSYTIWDDSEGF
jgi:hypothetical protein